MKFSGRIANYKDSILQTNNEDYIYLLNLETSEAQGASTESTILSASSNLGVQSIRGCLVFEDCSSGGGGGRGLSSSS